MRSDRRLTAIALAFFFLVPLALEANPFHSGGGSTGPAPVRTGSGNVFVETQFKFREQAATILTELKDAPSIGLLLTLSFACFAYGILHAIGPGHRKAVVFSLFLARKARWHEPLAAGFLSAGTHAAASVLLILALSLGRAAIVTLSGTDAVAIWMEGVTMTLVALLAMALIVAKAISLLDKKAAPEPSGRKRGVWSIVFFSSLAPCPGATMILLVSVYLEVLFAGAVAVVAMSVGMGLVISIAGYLAFSGREGLFSKLKTGERAMRAVSGAFEIASYSLLLAISLWAAWPFIVSVVRLAFPG